MYGKGAVLLKALILVAAVGIAAGCSTELRRLQGANQELVRQRDSLNREITDLKTQLAQANADKADLNAKLEAAQTEVNYWKGQAEAYGAANSKYASLAQQQSEKWMRDLAIRLGGVYLPGGGIRLGTRYPLRVRQGRPQVGSQGEARRGRAGLLLSGGQGPVPEGRRPHGQRPDNALPLERQYGAFSGARQGGMG